jgi:hypothetical protein
MFVKKTAKDLERLYAALSDDEKRKFDDGHESTLDEVEEAEERIEEKGADEQTEKDRVDEAVAADEEHDGDEDTQTAKDRVDEAEGEKAYDEEKHEEHEKEEEEAEDGQNARIEALEALVSELTERLEKVLAHLDDKTFGEKPEAPTEGASEDTESPVMRAYYGKSPRR